MARRNLAPNWKELFLDALRQGHTVVAAAQRAGISRRTAYLYRQTSPKFAEEWNDAIAEGLDHLMEIARARALDPTDKASAALLMFLIRHRLRTLGQMMDDDIIVE
jgi:hypothetical protein